MFTFQRAPNVPNSPSSFAAAVKGKTVNKIDDHTVRITTGAVSPTLPNDVATLMIVSKKHGEGAKTEDYNSGKAAIGTGPYKFAKFTPGDRIEFARNDAYWGPKPKWAKLQFRPITAGPARVAALLAGDVDMIEDTPTADIERLKKEPKIEISQGISNRLDLLLRRSRPRHDALRQGQGRRRDQEPVQGQARAPGHDQGDQPRRHRRRA